jgi:spore cortex biosynthesis protein YabQ
VGLGFDFYRIVRWQLGLNKVFTLLGDLLFSLAALLVIFFFAQKANYLEFRFYLFGATLLGLILYLRLFSPVFKKLFSRILKLIGLLGNLISKVIKGFFAGIARMLVALMSIPYGILCWFSLLLYRLLEALGRESVTKVKGRLTKTPRE